MLSHTNSELSRAPDSRCSIHVWGIKWKGAISANNDTGATWYGDEAHSGTGNWRTEFLFPTGGWSRAYSRLTHTSLFGKVVLTFPLHKKSFSLSLFPYCLSLCLPPPSLTLKKSTCTWISVFTEREKSVTASLWWISWRDSTDFWGEKSCNFPPSNSDSQALTTACSEREHGAGSSLGLL